MVRVTLASNVFKQKFEGVPLEEPDILEHIVKLLPPDTGPFALSLFGGLSAEGLRRVIAAHRAGYVLLSGTMRNWNGLVHSFIRCKNETRAMHPELWASTGIDLFCMPADSFTAVLLELHALTLGSLSQADWRSVRACLESLIVSRYPASDAAYQAALRGAQDTCETIIGDCRRTQIPLYRIEKAFAELVKHAREACGEDWKSDNYWPLTESLTELLKVEENDTFEKVVFNDPRDGMLLDRNALIKHSQCSRKDGARSRLATKLTTLISAEVEKTEPSGAAEEDFRPTEEWWPTSLSRTRPLRVSAS